MSELTIHPTKLQGTSSNLLADAVIVERSMFDRAKMIAVIEPDLSLCCLNKQK